jgi:hypothetical protein
LSSNAFAGVCPEPVLAEWSLDSSMWKVVVKEEEKVDQFSLPIDA